MPLNDWLALKITKSVGSMWAAYLFCCIALISVEAAFSSGNPILIINWISQSFLQLVLLPIILVGQNLLAQRHDETQDKLHEIHKHVHWLRHGAEPDDQP